MSQNACPSYPGPVRPLAGDGAPLRAGAGLQHVEQPEPDRLLQHRIPVDLDVRGVPEVIEVGALVGREAFPAGIPGAGERGRGLVAQRLR